ncbi:MAG: hypothetical protein HN352_00150 [Bacteroidetes bacterium]|jgi:hypothetical protein|nr:hypothetical protein [Bacteroidota bacterium]MBT3750136.1 hypothetical protein [Bacteroidota bacterium]MBT4400172.1 hypothetical protein [Bacteroidota bacterium]MBT4410072.1 hypothetical protein [Bacteroidota bacterium]MBT5426564.1 hypothetical protein [Bacteroidota bacterium]
MKKIVLLSVSIILLTMSQSYGQKTFKAKDIEIQKGFVFDADQDGDFDVFTFMVKKKKKSDQFVSAVQIAGIKGEMLANAKIVSYGNWDLYIFDIGDLNLNRDFKVMIEIGSKQVFVKADGFYIPNNSDGGPGGTPPPTVIIIKYP